jgi:hypothetical protein
MVTRSRRQKERVDFTPLLDLASQWLRDNEQVGLQYCVRRELNVSRRPQDFAKSVTMHVGRDEIVQQTQSSLVHVARSRAHEQLAAQQLVAPPVVRKCSDHFSSPTDVLRRHAHSVRSARRKWQEPDRLACCLEGDQNDSRRGDQGVRVLETRELQARARAEVSSTLTP